MTWTIRWSEKVSTPLPQSTKPADKRGNVTGSVVAAAAGGLGFIGIVVAVIVYIHKKKLGWLLCFRKMF